MTRIIGAPLNDAERETLRLEAMALLGTPWRHLGREGCGYGHQTGLDCAGALVRLMQAIERPVGDIDLYARTSDGSTLLANLDLHLGERVDTLAPWQIVHMPFGRDGHHIGLTLPGPDGDNRLMIWHSYNGPFPAGRVMWHGIDDQWRKRIRARWAL